MIAVTAAQVAVLTLLVADAVVLWMGWRSRMLATANALLVGMVLLATWLERTTV